MTHASTARMLAATLLVVLPLATARSLAAPPLEHETRQSSIDFGIVPEEKAQSTEAKMAEMMGLPPLPSWNPKPVPDPAPQSVPENSTRFMKGLFDCPCSPSKLNGSFPEEDARILRDSFNRSGVYDVMLVPAGQNPPPAMLAKLFGNIEELKTAIDYTKHVIKKCREINRMEGCINADAKLRKTGTKFWCNHDKTTGRNLMGGVTVGSCAVDERFNYTLIQVQHMVEKLRLQPLPTWRPTPVPDPAPQSVPDNSTRFRLGLFECPCSPSNRSGSLPEADVNTMRDSFQKSGVFEVLFHPEGWSPPASLLRKVLSNVNEWNVAVNATKEVIKKCTENNRVEACVNEDARLRKTVDQPLCSFDSESGLNLVNGVTVGSCAGDGRFNMTTKQIQARANEKKANEGCIAIEHLKGYVLQHPSHLKRPVLCARGFCATRNHGIIVDGEYTSMGRMCSKRWTCTERVTLVNNLKLAANRRARVSKHIVVTPYDIRFPKAAIWVVQILEDVWNMLVLSVCSGTVTGATFLLLSRITRTEK